VLGIGLSALEENSLPYQRQSPSAFVKPFVPPNPAHIRLDIPGELAQRAAARLAKYRLANPGRLAQDPWLLAAPNVSDTGINSWPFPSVA
jgi:hypothetical protein